MTHLERSAAVSLALFNIKHHDVDVQSFLNLQEKQISQCVAEVLVQKVIWLLAPPTGHHSHASFGAALLQPKQCWIIIQQVF